MGCWHGYHGCGPWHRGPYGRGWDEPVDWFEEPDWPVRRSYRRYRRREREVNAEELEARLEDLHAELRRVEAELASLRGTGGSASGAP